MSRMKGSEFLTVREAAEILRVDPATIYRAIRDNSFPAVRIRHRYVIPAVAIERLVGAALESGRPVEATVFVPTPRASDSPLASRQVSKDEQKVKGTE